jgi:hypothetical protein
MECRFYIFTYSRVGALELTQKQQADAKKKKDGMGQMNQSITWTPFNVANTTSPSPVIN